MAVFALKLAAWLVASTLTAAAQATELCGQFGDLAFHSLNASAFSAISTPLDVDAIAYCVSNRLFVFSNEVEQLALEAPCTTSLAPVLQPNGDILAASGALLVLLMG
jgi:hypothetical protein